MEVMGKIISLQALSGCSLYLLMITKRIVQVWKFYRDGFRSMTIGRTLWKLILIKLFIMFVILKLFFFPAFLKGKSTQEKQDYVGQELVSRLADENSLTN